MLAKSPANDALKEDLGQPSGPSKTRPAPITSGTPVNGLVTRALVLLLLTTPAQATSLYEASAITTGMDLRSRPAGLTACLAQVLAKVSGNPALLDDPRVAALGPAAPGLLAGLAYLDRMSDEPKHDEQGTRDRPYDLVARFEPAGIDAALLGLGEAPWLTSRNRPSLLADIDITPRDGPTMPLRADTDPDERHRAALLAAADRSGIPILLQPSLGPAPVAAATLHGNLAWQETAAGWVGAWALTWLGHEHVWRIAGVNFDEAYRNAMAGAAAALSGHALPPATVP